MKRLLTIALAASLLAACGDDEDKPTDQGPTLSSSAAIKAWVEGKTWLMATADLPEQPNGYSEDVGAFNQCYNQVEISVLAGTWTVDSTMASVTGDPAACSHTANGTVLSFDSTAVSIGSEVDWSGTPGTIVGNGDCFDLRVTYEGFAQAGRGRFTADGTIMELELYFAGQAGGSSCADGAVGSGIDTFPITVPTDSIQLYRLQP